MILGAVITGPPPVMTCGASGSEAGYVWDASEPASLPPSSPGGGPPVSLPPPASSPAGGGVVLSEEPPQATAAAKTPERTRWRDRMRRLLRRTLGCCGRR